MPNAKYNAGRRLEYLIRDQLLEQGFYVTRAAGSHGVDLVAIWFNPSQGVFEHHRILFVSCKLHEYIPPNEKRELMELARQYGAVPMTTRKIRGRWDIVEVEYEPVSLKWE